MGRTQTGIYQDKQGSWCVEALNRITDERSRINRSLAMIRWERLETQSPQEVPAERKMG